MWATASQSHMMCVADSSSSGHLSQMGSQWDRNCLPHALQPQFSSNFENVWIHNVNGAILHFSGRNKKKYVPPPSPLLVRFCFSIFQLITVTIIYVKENLILHVLINKIILYVSSFLVNSKGKNSYREADSCSAGHEIPHVLWNVIVHYHV
jgi:hypothetical protein